MRHGAIVLVTYMKEQLAGEIFSDFPAEPEKFRTDLTDENQVMNLISTIVNRFKRIDILVNVVGGYIGGKAVTELGVNEWDLMMTMNLKSAFLISKHTLGVMKSSGNGGKIVHVSSRNGLKSAGYDSAYAASKAG